MTRRAFVSTADKHPLAHLSHLIWGINIARTLQDLERVEAPEPIVRAFKLLTTETTPNRCACCGKMRSKPSGGMAVLRTHVPGQQAISIGICRICLREPVDTKLTIRIFKMLTGKDTPTFDWNDISKGGVH